MRTSAGVGTFLTLLFLLSFQLTTIGGIAHMPITTGDRTRTPSMAEPGSETNEDSLKDAEPALLIELAQEATLRGDLRRARSYYLQAFSSEGDSELRRLLLNYLSDVSNLYKRIARSDSALFDSLRSEPYSWKNYYFKVTRIEEVVGADGTQSFAHIDAPASFGLSDEVITIFGALGGEDNERELARIAEGDLAGSNDTSTYYKLRIKDAVSNWKVRTGDLLVVEHKGPAFEKDILADAYLNQVRFRDNYGEDPLSLAMLLSGDYPLYRPYFEALYHEQIAEIYELYKDDSIDLLLEVMQEGLFTGITGMDALGKSTWREESQFIRYAAEHLGTYMGSSYKFSEAYATWIIQHAPMSEEQYRDYFLDFSDSSRTGILGGYMNQILKKDLLKDWIEDASEALIDRRLPLALSLTELCFDIASLSGQEPKTAEILLVQAKVYLELNQDQRSLNLARAAEGIYDRIGDDQGIQTVRSFISDLTTGNKAEVIVQSGHTMPFELIFHPDGQFYYTGGWDGFIKMWDYRSGMIVKEVNAHEIMINSLSVSADGRYLVSADDMGYCKLFNAYTLDEIWTYRHTTEYIGEADINADGSLIALCGGDNNVYVLSANERKLIQKLKRHTARVTSVRFHPANDILMSAGRDSMVYTWNLPDFSQRGWYRDASQIYHIALSPDGRTFMLVRRDSSISFWDFYDASRLGVSSTTFKRMGTSVFFAKPCFSPDNRYAVYMYEGDRSFISFLRLADLRAHNFNNPHEDQISALTFHPGGNALLSAGHDLVVKTYDLSNYQFRETGTLRIVTNRPPAAPAIQVRFDTSGTHLLALISAQKFSLADLDLVNGERRLIQRNLLIGDQQQFIHNGDNSIRYIDTDRKLHIRNFDDRSETVIPSGLEDVDYYEFYPGMDKLCVRLLSDGSFRLLETESGKVLQHISLPNSRNLKTIYNFALFPEEDIAFAACNSHSLIRADLKTGKVDSIVMGKKGKLEIIGVKQTSDPEILLIHADRFVGLWNRRNSNWIWKHTVNPDKEVYTSIAVSGDLEYVALASYTYQVEVVAVRMDKVVWKSSDFGYFISNLAFNPKYPLLAVSCEDMRLSIYNYLDKDLVFQIFPQQNGDLILMDGDGSYWADKRSLNGLAFKVRTNIYPVEQFDVLFNRPDRVLRNSPCADPVYLKALEQATARRLEREGIRVETGSFALPNALIFNRSEIPSLTKKRSLELEVECSDHVDSLTRIFVSINGIPVLGSQGKPLSGAHFARERIDLELGYGANQIKVWCSNSIGLRSLRESLEINVTLETPRPDLYIGAMAVSNYKDDNYDLKYPVKDAGDLIRQLKIDTAAYGNVYVQALFDGDVRSGNLERLRHFFAGSQVQDRVLLFITGHGVLDDRYQFYYAASDLDFGKPAEKGISYAEIESLLEAAPARQRLLLMDACHSGELDRSAIPDDAKDKSATTETETPAEMPEAIVSGYQMRGGKTRKTEGSMGLQNSFNLMRELFTDIGYASGIQVISAASGDSYALESDVWQNGVFTYALLKGLRENGADRNRDGSILVSELRDYVIREVFEQTNGKQRPTVRSENIEFDFPLN